MLLLSAHFLRTGHTGIFAAWTLFALLVFTRKSWVRYIVILGLTLGVFIWIQTSISLVQFRVFLDMPWMRLLFIMTGVIVLNIVSIFILLSPGAAKIFHKDKDIGIALSATFVLSVLILGISSTETEITILILERFIPNTAWIEILLLGLYSTWICKKMLDKEKMPYIRSRIWSFFAVIFFLQLFLGLIGVEKMLMTGDLHLPVPALILGGPLYRMEGFFMPVLFVSTLILAGAAWCSYFCYIGALDDNLAKLSRSKKTEIPVWASVWLRLGMVLLVATSALIMRYAGVQTLYAVIAGFIFGIIGVLVMFLFSRKTGLMIHCTTYCPIGLISNTLGKINPWRIRISDDCTRCGICSSYCKYGALAEKHLNNKKPGLTCTLCGDCLPNCPRENIYYSLPGCSAEFSRTAFIILVVSIHTVFLGVARI